MFRARQAAVAVVTAAALSTTASACAGSPQPAASTTAKAPPVPSPLKSLTSYTIIREAFANTAKATNVAISGKVTYSGLLTRLSSLSLVNGGSGCIADLYRSGLGDFQLIYDGTTAWILPGRDYWQTTGTSYAAVLPAIEGKYLQVKPGDRGLGTLAGLCSLTTLVGTGPGPKRLTGFGDATPMVVGTLAALKIPDTADGGYAFVSDTGQPRFLSIYVPGPGGYDVRLSYSATPVTLSPPAPGEAVDGSRYGFLVRQPVKLQPAGGTYPWRW